MTILRRVSAFWLFWPLATFCLSLLLRLLFTVLDGRHHRAWGISLNIWCELPPSSYITPQFDTDSDIFKHIEHGRETGNETRLKYTGEEGLRHITSIQHAVVVGERIRQSR